MAKKAIALISSGIDSPVAVYLMLKQGLDIICVHMDGKPYSDGKGVNITKKLVKQLAEITDKELKLYIVPHGENLKAYKENCYDRFTCIFCKRMMIKIANKIADKENADYILTGESLGQVASQTLSNMKVIDDISDHIVLRPLLTNDKEETITIAREIGTYDIGLEKHIGCTALPKSPATRSTKVKLKREEDKIYLQNLIDESVSNSKIEKIK